MGGKQAEWPQMKQESSSGPKRGSGPKKRYAFKKKTNEAAWKKNPSLQVGTKPGGETAEKKEKKVLAFREKGP